MGKQFSEGLRGFVRLVERQMLLHEEKSKLVRQHAVDERTGPYQFITISRDIGALGDVIASELAGHLQWKVYDKEIVDYIVKDSHARHQLVDQLDEKTQSHVHDSVERVLLLFQGEGFSNDEYHIALIKALAALAAQGRCVILGHGGVYALQEQAGLHLRITASLPVRVRRMSRRWNLSLDQTRKIVQKTDQDRKSFLQYHFKPEGDPLQYFHLFFNTDRLSVDSAVGAILGVLEKAKQQVEAPQPPVIDSFAFQNSEQVPG